MTNGDARRRWLAAFPPLAIACLMIGGGSTPAGLDHPIRSTGTALTELPIAAAHSAQLYASNAFILLGLGALAVSFVVIAMLAGGFSSGWAMIGATLGVLGCFCGIVVNVLAGLDLGPAATTLVQRGSASQFLVAANTTSVSIVSLVVYLGGIVLGAIAVGVALWRSRAVARWLAVGFPVGLILGSAAPPGVLNVVLTVPVAVVSILLAIRIWHSFGPDPARSSAVDRRATAAAVFQGGDHL